MSVKTLPLFLFSFLSFFTLTLAQTVDTDLYRTLDGTFNNPDHPEWGAAGSNLQTIVGSAFADSMAMPAGQNRQNPRKISNEIFAQSGLVNDPLNLSDFCWVWGQFIDHDLGITPDGVEDMTIHVPAGDPAFDPMGMGQAIIPMLRSRFDPETGTSPENPRLFPNMVTAFIDGSGVYGSSEERANWLRSFEGGKLKTSNGNMPPFNTINGEFGGDIDHNAPEMDNPTAISDKYYVAGDVRANENPLLLSFHTLFMREHNRLCDKLAHEQPDWNDEQLYHHARKLVGGLIQSIVYEEWLPAMGVHLPQYQGFNVNTNPQLMNVFTAAAFRLGHTLLNGQLQRLNNEGEVIPQGNVSLRDAFFNPFVMLETGGIEPFFKGMAVQTQQKLDPKIIDDVRNFLFGPPGAGGLDLASININRGRERGLPDFNSIRAAIGLQPYSFYQQINSNASVFTRLLSLYSDINDIDPWVGMLAEEPLDDALFGETIMELMTMQFTDLRDGDRFFYLNDPSLTQRELDWIRDTRLRDVIMYNTGINLMQDNVFLAMQHSLICENLNVRLEGNIYTEDGESVSGVYVDLDVPGESFDQTTDATGSFLFQQVPGCNVQSLQLSKNDAANNGVTTIDLIFVQKHILGVAPLDSPYEIIAGDVDNNGQLTTLDLIRMRRVILGVTNEFPNNTSWRFIAADYEFIDPLNPLDEAFVEVLEFNGLLGANQQQDFIAVKVGDVNSSANLEFDEPLEERNLQPEFVLAVADQKLQKGETYSLDFIAKKSLGVMGYQFGLEFDSQVLSLQQIEPLAPEMGVDNFGQFNAEGLVTVSWNGNREVVAGEGLFRLNFQALEDVRLKDVLWLNDQRTRAESYNASLDLGPIDLHFDEQAEDALALVVNQNQPNPFNDRTTIPFFLPQDDVINLKVIDPAGRLVYQQTANMPQGHHQLELETTGWAASGVLYYQLETTQGTVSKKMVLVR
ncbi:MAG: hypothetical protein DHS20C18_53200 [Saprospiraceae bacterium]|nr:MAG: hypothetical protein DHS20C18_53200 [Saprospiraceae bacterium]